MSKNIKVVISYVQVFDYDVIGTGSDRGRVLANAGTKNLNQTWKLEKKMSNYRHVGEAGGCTPLQVSGVKGENFEKQLFLKITFSFIDDFTLSVDEINDFWSSDLWWPSLAFDDLLKQNPTFGDKR